MTGRNDAIGHLFHPKNVVLVGASDRPGHWSQRVYDNLKRFGFAGKVFPVNPNRSDIWGTPCYPKLDEGNVCGRRSPIVAEQTRRAE